MRESRRRFAAGLCLATTLLAAVFCGILLKSSPADPNSLARIGHPLPPLTVENSEGAVDLKTFVSGTRSVIVFYSPECENCRKAWPALQPFPDTLRLVLVNEAHGPDPSEHSPLRDAARFYDRWGVLSRSFVAPALPIILFVDEDGVLRNGIAGPHGRGYVQRKLNDFALHSYGYLNKNQ